MERRPWVPDEKLVRDRIPERIRQTQSFEIDKDYRKAEPEELRELLIAKLAEEVREYVSSHDPKELVDVMEVVISLALIDSVSPDELSQMRHDKLATHGGFFDRWVMFLKGTDDQKRAAVGLRPALDDKE